MAWPYANKNLEELSKSTYLYSSNLFEQYSGIAQVQHNYFH